MQQIEEALATAGNEDKSQLKELQANLLQLLELTLQQLNQQPSSGEVQDDRLCDSQETSESINPSDNKSEDNNLDDEFALFKVIFFIHIIFTQLCFV